MKSLPVGCIMEGKYGTVPIITSVHIKTDGAHAYAGAQKKSALSYGESLCHRYYRS